MNQTADATWVDTTATCRPDPPAPGGRRPQTIRIEHDGMIVEFCDGVASDPVLSRGPDNRPEAGQARLQCRIRSDGLLAHAVIQVAKPAISRFVRELDEMLQTGMGDASLAGGPTYPTALRIDADGAHPRLTLLACPALTTRTRIVIEALELDHGDLMSIRRWAADHR